MQVIKAESVKKERFQIIKMKFYALSVHLDHVNYIFLYQNILHQNILFWTPFRSDSD